MYYLQSRYYDPETGRFISMDSIEYLAPETIHGLNLYAYCANNPVMAIDPTGNTAWWEWLVAAVVVVGLAVGAAFTGGLLAAALTGAAIGGFISFGTSAISGNLNWGQFALDIGVGALTGLIGGSSISRIGATLLGGAIGGATSVASDFINGNPINWTKFGISLALGLIAGCLGGAGAKNTKAFHKTLGKNADWNKAMGSLFKVQNKIASGAYKTIQGASGALAIVNRNLSNAYMKAFAAYGIKAINTALSWYAGMTAGGNIISLILGW